MRLKLAKFDCNPPPISGIKALNLKSSLSYLKEHLK